MKCIRWGLCSALAMGIVVAASGCSYMPAVLRRSTYDGLRGYEGLCKRQEAYLTQQAAEKDEAVRKQKQLQAELDALRGGTGEKDALVGMLKERIAELERKIAEKPVEATTKTTQIGEGVEMMVGPFGVGVRIDDAVLFEPGKSALKDGAQKTMKKIAGLEALQRPGTYLRVCGFTDSDPIVHSGWEDNFHLSGERARNVLRALVKEGVDPARLHFAGFGEHMLVKDGGKEDKAKSRRVEIYVIEAGDVGIEQPVVPK